MCAWIVLLLEINIFLILNVMKIDQPSSEYLIANISNAYRLPSFIINPLNQFAKIIFTIANISNVINFAI